MSGHKANMQMQSSIYKTTGNTEL